LGSERSEGALLLQILNDNVFEVVHFNNQILNYLSLTSTSWSS
jgi:hypothetical protein